eukprot:TRINITY_DN12696_c0_g1_i2.p1 TRINITY_DN12696_c0_g1~~TRINITY_DN12696_c0_g1_i2.p1  ORF type:complete len:131 (+),score=32.99 TRINITY_DN12696_c0_g1_i2:119-511(+)
MCIRDSADAVRQAAGFSAESRPTAVAPSPAPSSTPEESVATRVPLSGSSSVVSTTQSGPAPRKVQRTRLVKEKDPEENKYHKSLLHQLFDNTLKSSVNTSEQGKVDHKRVFSLMLFIFAVGTLMFIYGRT